MPNYFVSSAVAVLVFPILKTHELIVSVLLSVLLLWMNLANPLLFIDGMCERVESCHHSSYHLMPVGIHQEAAAVKYQTMFAGKASA